MRPHGQEPNTTDTVEYEIECCFVDVEFNAGTYAQADDADFDPSAVIEATKRDGKTITVLGCSCAGIGNEGSSVLVGADVITSVTSNTVLVPLLLEDLTTERGASAMGTAWDKAIPFFVCYKQPVEA
jgi:hypothetical protein